MGFVQNFVPPPVGTERKKIRKRLLTNILFFGFPWFTWFSILTNKKVADLDVYSRPQILIFYLSPITNPDFIHSRSNNSNKRGDKKFWFYLFM